MKKNIKFEILIELAGIIYGIIVYTYYTQILTLEQLKISSLILFFTVILITILVSKLTVKKKQLTENSFQPRARIITCHENNKKNKKSLKRRSLDFSDLLSL